MNYNQNWIPYYGAPQQYTVPSPGQQYQYSSNVSQVPMKIFVNDLEDAKSRLLAPNTSAIFWDSKKPVIYEKIVNSDGSFIINTYEMISNNSSVTRDEFKELQKQLDELATLVKGKEVVNA